MLDIEKLEDEIFHQSRNGRQDIYVKVDTLKELLPDMTVEQNCERVFINKNILEQGINQYRNNNRRQLFKNSLKVDTLHTPLQVQKEHTNNIDCDIER